MPTLVELEQLLDISLTTPEVGTVNFNILRVFLREILRHLNIQNKIIDIDTIAEELKSAYDFLKDGYVEVSQGRSPSPIRPQTEPIKRPQVESSVRPQTEPPEMPQIAVETRTEQEELSKEEQAGGEESQVLVVECKSESLVVPEKESSASPSPPKSAGLSVKEPPPPSRSAVMLLGRSESLRTLKKKFSELQDRVEFLESQPAVSTPPVPVPDPVRSAASLVRKESRTPAHDFVELINIKRKLEASENSLEGLTEMVDALTSDLNELKENLPNGLKETHSDMRSDIKELKSSLDAIKNRGKDEEISKLLEKLEDNQKKMSALESMLANLKEAMVELTNKTGNVGNKEIVTTDLPPKVSEALQALDVHEKQLQGLEAQIREVKGKIEGTDQKSSGAGEAASDALARVEVCGEGINDIRDKLAALEKELTNQKSLIEDNEMQTYQLKNTLSLMKRESVERANEEAEKKKGRGIISVIFSYHVRGRYSANTKFYNHLFFDGMRGCFPAKISCIYHHIS